LVFLIRPTSVSIAPAIKQRGLVVGFKGVIADALLSGGVAFGVGSATAVDLVGDALTRRQQFARNCRAELLISSTFHRYGIGAVENFWRISQATLSCHEFHGFDRAELPVARFQKKRCRTHGTQWRSITRIFKRIP
jgi:hypothetical protein